MRDTTTTTLNFLARAQRARIYFEADGPGSIDEQVIRAPRRQDITDARGQPVAIDTHGLALVRAPTAADPYNPDARYDAEIAAILTAAVGAAEVRVFDHTLRFEDASAKTRREPVYSVHYDYTDESGPKRMRDLLSADEADRWAQGRYAIFNLWRPLRLVERTPLAFADERHVTRNDRGLIELVYPDRVGGNYGMHPREGLRWLTFPRMTPDEIVVFKTFDSDTTQPVRYVGHTAFDDELHTTSSAPPRRSIETRALVRLR